MKSTYGIQNCVLEELRTGNEIFPVLIISPRLYQSSVVEHAIC